MNIFYCPDLRGNEAILNEEESRHAIRVLRLREGDPITIVDGKGNWYDALIAAAHPKRCQATLQRLLRKDPENGHSLHMAVAPTKNADRMEWWLEKATEIGLDAFTPLLCRFSERKQLNGDRMEKIAVSAMKQSMKAWLPALHPVTPFELFVRQPFSGLKCIAHCHPGDKPSLRSLVVPRQPVLVLIGPEGDFSPEEVELARQQGFTGVTLGSSRLRTETAALAACLIVSLANEL